MTNEEKNIILKAIKDNITASDYDIAKIPLPVVNKKENFKCEFFYEIKSHK